MLSWHLPLKPRRGNVHLQARFVLCRCARLCRCLMLCGTGRARLSTGWVHGPRKVPKRPTQPKRRAVLDFLLCPHPALHVPAIGLILHRIQGIAGGHRLFCRLAACPMKSAAPVRQTPYRLYHEARRMKHGRFLDRPSRIHGSSVLRAQRSCLATLCRIGRGLEIPRICRAHVMAGPSPTPHAEPSCI